VIKDIQMETIAIGVHMESLYRLDVKSMPQQAMVAAGSTAENL